MNTKTLIFMIFLLVVLAMCFMFAIDVYENSSLVYQMTVGEIESVQMTPIIELTESFDGKIEYDNHSFTKKEKYKMIITYCYTVYDKVYIARSKKIFDSNEKLEKYQPVKILYNRKDPYDHLLIL